MPMQEVTRYCADAKISDGAGKKMTSFGHVDTNRYKLRQEGATEAHGVHMTKEDPAFQKRGIRA